MHHKRKRPKNRRAGCIFCKPNKANGAKPREAGPGQGRCMSIRRAVINEREQRRESA